MLKLFWLVLAAVQSLQHYSTLDSVQSSAKLQALQSCAKRQNAIEVSETCLYTAKYPRSRRASSTFLKSELEAMCSLPCQKSRLFTTPKVNDFDRNTLVHPEIINPLFSDLKSCSMVGSRTESMIMISNLMST